MAYDAVTAKANSIGVLALSMRIQKRKRTTKNLGHETILGLCCPLWQILRFSSSLWSFVLMKQSLCFRSTNLPWLICLCTKDRLILIGVPTNGMVVCSVCACDILQSFMETSECLLLSSTYIAKTLKLRTHGTANKCPQRVNDAFDCLVWISTRHWCKLNWPWHLAEHHFYLVLPFWAFVHRHVCRIHQMNVKYI